MVKTQFLSKGYKKLEEWESKVKSNSKALKHCKVYPVLRIDETFHGSLGIYNLWFAQLYCQNLMGVFAKNERGYRLTKNNRK